MKKIAISTFICSSLLLLSGCGTTTVAPAVESVADQTIFVQPVGFSVDTAKCSTSPLLAKEFATKCTYLAEARINNHITMKAVQNIPKGVSGNQKINIGENIHLEFFKDGVKMPIPEQVFHTDWSTDVLGLAVSYVDDDHIYVEGKFVTPKPSSDYTYSYRNGDSYDNVYTYVFRGGVWKELVLQDIVQDSKKLNIFASKTLLKVVPQEGCQPHVGSSSTFSMVYLLDATTYEVIKKENMMCR